MRFPLTLPLRDKAGPEALLFWTNGQVNTMVFGERVRESWWTTRMTSSRMTHPPTPSAHALARVPN